MPWEQKIRKYEKGSPIFRVADAVYEIEQGRYLWIRGRPWHPAIVWNWTLPTLRGAVRTGCVSYADTTARWVKAHPEPANALDTEFQEVE